MSLGVNIPIRGDNVQLTKALVGSTKSLKRFAKTTEVVGRRMRAALKIGGIIGLVISGILLLKKAFTALISSGSVDKLKELGDRFNILKENIMKIVRPISDVLIGLLMKAMQIVINLAKHFQPMGEAAAKGLKKVVEFLKPIAEVYLQGLVKAIIFVKALLGALWEVAKKVFSSIQKAVGVSMGDVRSNFLEGAKAVQEFIFRGLAFLITAIENWRLVMGIAITAVALGWERGINSLIHLMKAAVDMVMWFGRNWKEILIDMGEVANKIFTNIIKNAVDFFKALGTALTGGGFQFKTTDLLEGFESSIKEALPQIATRVASARERALQMALDLMLKDLGLRSNAKFRDLMGEASDLRSDLDNEIESPSAFMDKDKKKEKEKKKKEEKVFQSQTVALEALAGRIQAGAAGGRKKNPQQTQEDIFKAIREQLVQEEAQTKSLASIDKGIKDLPQPGLA